MTGECLAAVGEAPRARLYVLALAGAWTAKRENGPVRSAKKTRNLAQPRAGYMNR